jgi:hypothetical protein
LYISSTIEDFHEERQYIHKHTIPLLRIWCERRKIQLIEVDLAWGLSTTSRQDQVLLAMQELERCREENGCPFFLSLLGEKYGLSITQEENMHPMLKQFGCIGDFSKIANEIVYGAYSDCNPNSLFLQRDPTFLSHFPETAKSIFVDTGPPAGHLSLLKQNIKDRFRPNQLLNYSVAVEHTLGAGGDTMPRLTSFEQMSTSIVEFFCKRIAWQFPEHPPGAPECSMMDLERRPHQLFVDLRGEAVYGRTRQVSRVLSSIVSGELRVMRVCGGGGGGRGGSSGVASGLSPSCAVSKTAGASVFQLGTVQKQLVGFLACDRHPVTVIAGEAGAGKSALIAHLV